MSKDFIDQNKGYDQYGNGHVKSLGNINAKQGGVNESKPANVPNNFKQSLPHNFTEVTSDGPWVDNAAKKANGNPLKDWAMIAKADTNYKPMTDAGK